MIAATIVSEGVTMNFVVAGPFRLTRHGTKKLITDHYTKETRFLRKISVGGIFNPKKGKPHGASRELKKTLCVTYAGEQP
jgi:hypothetical protein